VERIRWLVHDDIRTLAQAALAFTLSNPAISCATPGFRTVDQIEENLAAGDLFPLPQEDLDELASMYEDEFGFALPTSDPNPWNAL
jgi:aryl-alcohol dehydrogenase-like predicted oxidoreductase